LKHATNHIQKRWALLKSEIEMKFSITLLIFFSLLFQNCKKEKIILNPKNELKKFSTVKEQIFDLDTLSFSEIKGKNGTLIYFNKSDFNIKKESKVKVILREYFSLEDLVFNNINTITDKRELLESSGVIYLSFETENKKIYPKKNKFIIVKLPKEQLKESEIFYAKIDSLSQFKWQKDKLNYSTIINKRNVGGGITVRQEYLIPSDSISYYNEKWKKENEEYQNRIAEINKMNDYASRLLSGKYQFVNFDSFIESNIKRIDLEAELIGESTEQLTFYILYKNRNSFVSIYKSIDNLSFKQIPIIENETSILVIGNKNGKLLSDLINIEINSKENIKINLKKTERTEIENILKK
jgi:hypothetical protein